jgi:hypothetical protein
MRISDAHGNIVDVDPVQITQQMLRYFTEVLEIPRVEFGGLPACPFVRREREQDKIRYDICEIADLPPSIENVERVRQFTDEPYHTTLLLIDPYTRLSVSQCVQYGVELSKAATDRRMVAIGVHPDDPFEIGGMRPRCIPYLTMLCQSVDLLQDAKQRLNGSAYYKRWTRAAREYNLHQIGVFLR